MWDYRKSAIDDRQRGGDQVVAAQDFRADLVLETYDQAGHKVVAYHLHRCWPSDFVAAPDLDASGDAVTILSLRLEIDG